MIKKHVIKAHLWLFVLLFASLSGCSIFQGEVDETEGWSANKLYNAAKSSMGFREYDKAIGYFETLEARYPLGRFAQQAQLETAYAYFKNEEPDLALGATDRFMRMNPRSPHIDYALYLRGLVNFDRGTGLIERLFPRDIADLDTVSQKEAFHDFSKLVKRFPDSKYASDTQQRIQYLRNTLAETEVNVARYYMQRGAWLAAFNRAEYTIKHYNGTPAMLDALEIKVLASRRLGKNDLAADNLRVLEANSPERAAALKVKIDIIASKK